MQVVGADESLAADVALVGPQAGVDAHVVLQVVVVSESGAALLAQVGLLARVFPHVDLQLVLPAGEREDRGGHVSRGSAFVPRSQDGAGQRPVRVEQHPGWGSASARG